MMWSFNNISNATEDLILFVVLYQQYLEGNCVKLDVRKWTDRCIFSHMNAPSILKHEPNVCIIHIAVIPKFHSRFIHADNDSMLDQYYRLPAWCLRSICSILYLNSHLLFSDRKYIIFHDQGNLQYGNS